MKYKKIICFKVVPFSNLQHHCTLCHLHLWMKNCKLDCSYVLKLLKIQNLKVLLPTRSPNANSNIVSWDRNSQNIYVLKIHNSCKKLQIIWKYIYSANSTTTICSKNHKLSWSIPGKLYVMIIVLKFNTFSSSILLTLQTHLFCHLNKK